MSRVTKTKVPTAVPVLLPMPPSRIMSHGRKVQSNLS